LHSLLFARISGRFEAFSGLACHIPPSPWFSFVQRNRIKCCSFNKMLRAGVFSPCLISFATPVTRTVIIRMFGNSQHYITCHEAVSSNRNWVVNFSLFENFWFHSPINHRQNSTKKPYKITCKFCVNETSSYSQAIIRETRKFCYCTLFSEQSCFRNKFILLPKFIEASLQSAIFLSSADHAKCDFVFARNVACLSPPQRLLQWRGTKKHEKWKIGGAQEPSVHRALSFLFLPGSSRSPYFPGLCGGERW